MLLDTWSQPPLRRSLLQKSRLTQGEGDIPKQDKKNQERYSRRGMAWRVQYSLKNIKQSLIDNNDTNALQCTYPRHNRNEYLTRQRSSQFRRNYQDFLQHMRQHTWQLTSYKQSLNHPHPSPSRNLDKKNSGTIATNGNLQHGYATRTFIPHCANSKGITHTWTTK